MVKNLIKNKKTLLLWILAISFILVNEISYNYASPTRDSVNNTSIHSLAGYSGPLSVLGGTARYVTAQEGIIDEIAMYIGCIMIFASGVISWRARKSKAPILFPTKGPGRV